MTEQELSQNSKGNKPRFFYGYWIVAASFNIQLLGFGIYLTSGVFLNHILAEFGWLRATLSVAYSLAFVLMGFAAVIGGILSDRFGPRMVITACVVLFGLGHLLLSQVSAIWQWYLFYILIGIGIGGIEVVPLVTLARWFTKRRGLMTAVAKVGVGIGIFMIPLLASWLISDFGWRTAYVVLGSLVLVIGIPFAQLLRRDPGTKNLLPDGEPTENIGGQGNMESGLTFREAVRTWQFWVLCGVYLTFSFCLQTITVHIAPHAKSLGFAHAQADRLIAAIGGMSIFGRMAMGYTGDRVGNRRAAIISILVLVVALSWIQYASELWELYLFAAFYGFTHGGVVTIISPLVAELFGTRAHGSLLGTVLFVSLTMSAAGPFLAGYIFDVYGSYQLAFLLLLGVAVIGLIFSILLKPVKKGETYEQGRGTEIN